MNGQELVGLTIYDVDPQAPGPGKSTGRSSRGGDHSPLETVHRTKSREVFPVEVTTNYVEFEGHEYNLPFARDISARKKVEAELRESEERLRLALVASNQGTWNYRSAHRANPRQSPLRTHAWLRPSRVSAHPR